MLGSLLGKEEIRSIFAELDQEPGAMNVKADLYGVGGAAMAIPYDSRRATRNIEAIVVPSNEVREAAR